MNRPMHNPHFSRRRMLSGLGLGAVASSFLPLLNASGQEGLAPKRLITFFTPHGTMMRHWRPSGDENNFELSRILAPLEPFKSRMNVLNGLDIHSPQPGGTHERGPALLWTGSPLERSSMFKSTGGGRDFGWNTGPSVDQVIAERVGKDTPYRSLELGVRSGETYPGSRTIYKAAGEPVDPEQNPYALVERMFATGAGGGGATFEQLRLERKSTLDLINAELQALSPRLAQADRVKMEAHLGAIRTIEQRLDTSGLQPGCGIPMLGDQVDHDAQENKHIIVDRQIELLSSAVACDLTRVASLQFRIAESITGNGDKDYYNWLPFEQDRHHHSISHDPEGHEKSTADKVILYTWFASRFAYLLEQLDAIPEGEGSVLDNSLVVWGSEMSNGDSHNFDNVPFVLVGSLGGKLQTGRWQDYRGIGHNRLLVSMCNLMGLEEIDTFGGTDQDKGPLARL